MKSIEAHALHQRARDDVYVEGRSAAKHAIDWRGNDWTRTRKKSGASKALRYSMRNNLCSTRMSRRRRRPHQCDYFRWSPQRYHAARFPGRDGTRHLRWLDHGSERRGRGRRVGKSGAIRWRCCRSAATTSAIISGTGSKRQTLTNPPLILRELLPNLRMENFCGPGWRQHAGAEWIIDRLAGRVGALNLRLSHSGMQDLDPRNSRRQPNQMCEASECKSEEWQKEVSDHAKFFEY